MVIVFPVYFADVPDIVKSFVEKLNFNINTHIYAIATCNGVAGHSLFTIDKLLKKGGKIICWFFNQYAWKCFDNTSRC